MTRRMMILPSERWRMTMRDLRSAKAKARQRKNQEPNLVPSRVEYPVLRPFDMGQVSRCQRSELPHW